jgi:triosephosphate isomerase (TIM)
MSARKPLMAGNWKMNLNHLEAIALTQKIAYSLDEKDLEAVDVVVLPPFTHIRSVQTLIDGDRLAMAYGAQDISQHAGGAYTGDISGSMLAKLGCRFVVVGHSERREYHQEGDALVNAKAKAAITHGITPIICVGEPLSVREEGTYLPHVLAQLDAALAGIDAKAARSIVIAYEPVWAIGTGRVASPEDAQEVCAAIRNRLADLYAGDVADEIRVLYGGSVKSGSIIDLMREADIDGALIGGASLEAEEFARICRFPRATPLHP